jgi:hypothetical protein
MLRSPAEDDRKLNVFLSCHAHAKRVSKDIQVDAKHAVRLSATVRNLTNHFNPLEVHSNIADPQYGEFFGNNDRRAVLDFDVLF